MGIPFFFAEKIDFFVSFSFCTFVFFFIQVPFEFLDLDSTEVLEMEVEKEDVEDLLALLSLLIEVGVELPNDSTKTTSLLVILLPATSFLLEWVPVDEFTTGGRSSDRLKLSHTVNASAFLGEGSLAECWRSVGMLNTGKTEAECFSKIGINFMVN